MRVKVSVLSEPQPLAVASRAELVDALEPGVTGVIVTRDRRRATFLPAVWAKLSDPDEFLDALWAKAGLRARVWDARVRVATYTTVELVDPGPAAATGSESARCLTHRSARVDFDRMIGARVAKVRAAMEAAGVATLVCCGQNNVSYLTGARPPAADAHARIGLAFGRGPARRRTAPACSSRSSPKAPGRAR